ncbi:MAG: prolipoprotein diacylglyceryl transferase [Clostridiales bacterium]|jgi:phosphatidylglycerol:prolipoprotein diacylglycerol transferase|nr:prolipoprotein diacylglyceryl transferase [Clostridiales bacterium]
MAIPDRVAFTLFGHPIYWYGVLMAVGIIVAIFLALAESRRKKINEDAMLDLFIIVILSGVLGARLYYVVFEWSSYFGPGIPWWKAFAVWEGGLAIYGAVIGGLLGMLVYAKRKKVQFLILTDVIAPGLVLAQAIGRWGNFFNQEAFGLPVTNPGLLWFPFSVHIETPHTFDGVICTNPYHLATFFYESVWCLLIFLFLWFYFRKRAKHNGDVFLSYALLYSFERVFVESLRGDSLWLVKDVIRVSQLLSAVLFVGVAAFLTVRRLKEKKSGTSACTISIPSAEEPAFAAAKAARAKIFAWGKKKKAREDEEAGKGRAEPPLREEAKEPDAACDGAEGRGNDEETAAGEKDEETAAGEKADSGAAGKDNSCGGEGREEQGQ